MEHQRIQRTSSWSPTFTKRNSTPIESPETVQQKTAPAPQLQQSGPYVSPVPSDWVQRDPVIRQIMASDPVLGNILQPDWKPSNVTQGNASTDAVQQESIQLKCASCTAGDSVQIPESELQSDNSSSSAREVQLASNGEKSSESKIQQVAATGFSGSSTSLPHLDRIQQSFGVDLSGVQAYIGGSATAACQQMGAAAYASGNRIAFQEQPSLELAAHEAAHIVQQASGKVQLSGGVGKVGDEYENHADAVAAKVATGQKVEGLLSEYQGTNPQIAENVQAKQQAPKIAESITQLSANRGNSLIQLYRSEPLYGERYRVSDDSSIAVRQENYGSHDLWAAPGKAEKSNKQLEGVKSGVRLEANYSNRITVPTLENGQKNLYKVRAINLDDDVCTPNMKIWADCGRAARQVIGGNQGTRGVYKDPASGGRNPIWKTTVKTPDPTVMKWQILEDVLRRYEQQLGRKLLDEKEIRQLKNDNNAKNSTKTRKKLADYFVRVYNQLPPEVRNDLDRRARINRWANPQVGQAYTISSGGPAMPGREEDTWNFHWAGVVMKSDDGRDNVTLENNSVSNYNAKNERWIFQMYGSAIAAKTDDEKLGQTFHEEHKNMNLHGQNPTTMVAEPTN